MTQSVREMENERYYDYKKASNRHLAKHVGIPLIVFAVLACLAQFAIWYDANRSTNLLEASVAREAKKSQTERNEVLTKLSGIRMPESRSGFISIAEAREAPIVPDNDTRGIGQPPEPEAQLKPVYLAFKRGEEFLMETISPIKYAFPLKTGPTYPEIFLASFISDVEEIWGGSSQEICKAPIAETPKVVAKETSGGGFAKLGKRGAAAHFHVLVSINPVDPKKLQIGSSILVPLDPRNPDSQKVSIPIVQGDTFWKISIQLWGKESPEKTQIALSGTSTSGP
jgi:hypothetical protein